MPIRPENRDRYPADWPAISAEVREAAGQKCQRCGVPNGSAIRRGVSAAGEALWREAGWSAYMDGVSAETGLEVADTSEDTVEWGRVVRVVLTVAHLDHRPENCDRANLRAWCQRCHNAYDAPMRRAGIAARADRAVADLFG